MTKVKNNINILIEIINRGGSVMTGIDVYNKDGVLLLAKNVRVHNVYTLLVLKKNGLYDLPIDYSNPNGLLDKDGKPISLVADKKDKKEIDGFSNLKEKIEEIEQLTREAATKYQNAKSSIKKVISDIRNQGGEFEVEKLEADVTEILNFLTINDSAFSYLTKEIFSYDDYLSNHSVNICTIGTAILKRFNDQFSEFVNDNLTSTSFNVKSDIDDINTSFIYYHPDDLHDLALGFFMHDVGKVLIPDEILNKKGRLTDEEFEVVKTHSYEKGLEVLEKNGISNPFIRNTIQYHHSSLFVDEARCYPADKIPLEIPPYVKVCKLADIYDAMTSKRVYKEAFNPVSVVTEIFRKYSNKDRLLQFILLAFVKVVGIAPPGSILYLQNGQMAYVLNNDGPIVLPFTDNNGNPLREKPDPINAGDPDTNNLGLKIDRRKSLQSLTTELFEKLPPYLKTMIRKPV